MQIYGIGKTRSRWINKQAITYNLLDNILYSLSECDCILWIHVVPFTYKTNEALSGSTGQ